MSHEYYKTQDWFEVRDRVMTRDGYVCQYCGGPAYSADHVTPRHLGGADTEENLVAVCRSCNRYFYGNYFGSFDEKRAFYKEHVLDPWREYVERATAYERKKGKPLTRTERRRGKKTMIAEGRYPFHPSTLCFDHRCLTCGNVAHLKQACDEGWPNESMCHQCADERGIPRQVRAYVPTLKVDPYERLAEQDEGNIAAYHLKFRKEEQRIKQTMTSEQKLAWNLENADRLDAMMELRRVCRTCGRKTSNFVIVDGQPVHETECTRDPEPRVPNAVYHEPTRKKTWQVVSQQARRLSQRTTPKDFLPRDIVRDTKTQAEIHAWNLLHADWLELTMSTRRVCRLCGKKTSSYILVDSLPRCDDNCEKSRELCGLPSKSE